MSNAVKKGYNRALVAHRWRKAVYCSNKIVGFAAEQNNVVGAVEAALLNGLHLCAQFAAVLQLYDQPVALKLGCSALTDEKRHVSPALKKHSAEISSERTRAQYQVPHCSLRSPAYCRRIKACCATISLEARTAMGRSRRFGRPPATSDVPRGTDIARSPWRVSKVPKADMGERRCSIIRPPRQQAIASCLESRVQ